MFTSRGFRGATAALCAALLLTVSACGTDETESDEPQHIRLYGTDGNMQNSFITAFKEKAGLLDGMKGTTPLTPLSGEFKNRVLSMDSKVADYLYAAESYDAVAISALAAQLAGSTDPDRIAEQIVAATNGGTRCDSVEECLALARRGTDIAYRGVSMQRAGFTDVGEPSTASYATLHFDNGRINDAKSEFVGAGNESDASSARAPRPAKQDGLSKAQTGAPLKIGGLLPKTGDLAIAYPPLAAGATLAIKEINAAGGVLGEKVVWVDGDDGTSVAVAKQTVASHVAAGVHVIIGAGASSISREVLPDVIAAGLILFSPANTDAGFTSLDDKGRYFRTAPSDYLQGRALADVLIRDGSDKIAIVARNDSYGTGLQENVRSELENAGIDPAQVKLLTYEVTEDEATISFDDQAREITQFGADAVLIIGFAESAEVILALDRLGVALGK
ncbi:ABC transporter substrate-binding protein [Melissospora conviva]|uniref:ABC transporter substrate-binding protein n=1 Tax=Melissospora conviva TaxID=3388432 RepID=UPI003C189AE4